MLGKECDNGGRKASKVLFHPKKYHEFCPSEFTFVLKFAFSRRSMSHNF